MPTPDDTGNPLAKTTAAKRRPRRPRISVPGSVPSVPPVYFSAPSASLPVTAELSFAATTIENNGAQFVELFTANKWLRWTVFWFAWLWISPETIIPGAIAVGVGNVFYKERAFNLVTVCAAYLGVFGYLLLGHMINDWPEQVRLYMGFAAIFSFIVLGIRYPMFGCFLIIMVCSAIFRGGGRRRW